jgi:hypothetical protein
MMPHYSVSEACLEELKDRVDKLIHEWNTGSCFQRSASYSALASIVHFFHNFVLLFPECNLLRDISFLDFLKVRGVYNYVPQSITYDRSDLKGPSPFKISYGGRSVISDARTFNCLALAPVTVSKYKTWYEIVHDL